MTTNVVLYSGGMDSYIAARLLSHDSEDEWALAYVNMHTRYSEKEMNNLTRLGPDYWPAILPLDLGTLETPSAFLPQRNLMLLTYVQAYYDADKVVLAAVRGEYSRDKHPTFFKRTSELLSYTAGKPVECFSPLARMTKTQAVAEYLKRFPGGGPRLRSTISCYHSESLACGRCMSCYRRWVALENNGLTQDWDSPPWEWIRERNSSPAAMLSELRKLPASQWLDFGVAQLDALRAHAHLAKRISATA